LPFKPYCLWAFGWDEDFQERYDSCCSIKCKDFIILPDEQSNALKTTIEFNGTKFGKGRYKANKKDEPLEI
jgi:UPF0176 protein